MTNKKKKKWKRKTQTADKALEGFSRLLEDVTGRFQRADLRDHQGQGSNPGPSSRQSPRVHFVS
jgi:hypothetical protein